MATIRATKQVPIDTIRPHPENPNQGDDGAITQSLKHHGQYRAIVVSEATGNIVAGNHTYLAAKANGETKILAHLIPNLSLEDEKRIMLADNQYARLATSDDALLVELLTELAESQDGLIATGYDGDDLDLMIADLMRDQEEPEPEPPIEVPSDPTTKPGDVWQLGPHRLVCGDASDPTVWAKLCDGAEPITVAVTSPPYADRRDYDKTSGFKPIPPDDYVEWFRPIAKNVADNLADDGSWFVNIKPGVAPGGLDTELYVLDLVLAHVREWGWHFATEFCWERNGVPKSVTRRFKNQFEPVYQFTLNDWKMRPDNVMHYSDNVPVPFGEGAGNTSWDGRGDIAGQGKGDVLRHKSASDRQGTGHGALRHKKRKSGTGELMADVPWTSAAPGEYIGPGLAYPGNRLPTFAGTHTALGHAAAYPVGLAQFFIEAYTDPGDVTCDPMAGTGSTLIAADNTDRIGLAIELSPAYCDVIVKRWESLSPDHHANLMG